MSAVGYQRSATPDLPANGDVDTIIEHGGEALRERMIDAEQRLAEIGAGASGPLASHAADTIAAGGKRMRPLLVFLAAEAAAAIAANAQRRTLAEAGAEHDTTDDPLDAERTGVAQPSTARDRRWRRDAALVRAAVAVELVHSATLVHDDVLDGAQLRRGRPTVVAAGGRMMAVAAGDLLFARAFAELARNGSSAQLRALSDASSALAAGELLQREDAYRVDVALERYLHRCELKTAYLFEAACRLGALAVVHQDESFAVEVLGGYGRRIGLAFQLLDDVLDVSGPASRTGKHRGTDLLDGTVTLPLILARERDGELARLDLRRLSGATAAEDVCDRIAATGALADARRRALEIVSVAKTDLPHELPGAQRRLLELVADAVVQRYT